MTSSTKQSRLLISPRELSELLNDNSASKPVILDASWHMPNLNPPRDAYAEYKQIRLPGARFWHVDNIATKATSGLVLPHMMPTPETFANACRKLGISRTSQVVVYDSYGMFTAPRTLFTFKAFGHERVSVLDGGLPRWRAEGHKVEESIATYDKANEATHGPRLTEALYGEASEEGIDALYSSYEVPKYDASLVRSYQDVVDNSKKKLSESGAEIVLDARPAGRFRGVDPEPRAGLSSGHVPRSFSLPFSTLLSKPTSTKPSYQTLLPPRDLEAVFVEALGGQETWQQVKNGDRGVFSTCGSGMTAAVIWLALKVAGREQNAGLYDESWTGYASRPESKIEKGTQ
ncbi:hypothetical protein OIO90_003077 [Microbotryomycetes sp. JL221]|nr:hypothetical protein OIO90_003077 [Microbotryomycetes sp. JL221]